MADNPVSDTSRAKHHEPNRVYPEIIKIQLHWNVEGHTRVRTELIDANRFFGLGQYGAPLEGAALISMIENMRREGPPEVPLKPRVHRSPAKRNKNAKIRKKR